ncbi:unnamed protein product, partial [Ectocarpus sp. 8 AP-2014]
MDMQMSIHHDRIKSAKVEQLQKKKQKLEKDEEKFRGLANVAWMAFPEKKRNAQRKINEVDAELLALTNVNVHRSFAISDSVSATN